MSLKTLTNDGMHRHSLLPGHAWVVHEGFVNPGDLKKVLRPTLLPVDEAQDQSWAAQVPQGGAVKIPG